MQQNFYIETALILDCQSYLLEIKWRSRWKKASLYNLFHEENVMLGGDFEQFYIAPKGGQLKSFKIDLQLKNMKPTIEMLIYNLLQK